MGQPVKAVPVLPDRDDTRDQEFTFGDEEFKTIASIVRQHTGIVLGPHKRTMAYSRLVRRLRHLGLSSFADYCNLLKGERGSDELGFLINAITTNLTKFFRESHHFDHLGKTAVPQFISSNAGKRKIRIWSAGCSTGEEPYSVAMTIADIPSLRTGWDVRVLATDLDTSVLSKASQGTYSDEATEDVPSARRLQHFRELDGGKSYQVNRNLRDMILFNQLNLLGHWPISGEFDAIFCRNVMIYFDNPTKKTLVERFASKLKVGGWLYIGHSETLLDHHANLRPAGRTVYQKVENAG